MRSPIRRGSVIWNVLRRIPYLRLLRTRYLRRREMANRKTAIVYVDGFNLYRNSLKGRPEAKWLDLVKLCEQLLPGLRIKRVRFFTAEIHALQGTDPRAPSRQKVYLRALAVDPRVTIHRGKFLASKRFMAKHPVQLNGEGRPETVKVRKVEEKQSDVNLGAQMVLDAARNEADVYVLLSSDSDFAGVLRLLKEDMGKVTGLISPIESVTGELRNAGPRYLRRVRAGALLDSQLPDHLADDVGSIARPEVWQKKSRGPVTGAPQPVAEASGDVIPR